MCQLRNNEIEARTFLATCILCAIHKKLTDIQTDQGASMHILFSCLVLSNINSTINGLLKFKVTEFD